jgi:outer membrane protein insertion porin family
VVRRELRQLEGSVYNAANVKRSKDRVELLGYFEDVNVETPAVADAPDQVDMNISLKERATGSISAGVGFVQVRASSCRPVCRRAISSAPANTCPSVFPTAR